MLFSILQFWLKNSTETSDHTADCLQQVFNSLKPIRFFSQLFKLFLFRSAQSIPRHSTTKLQSEVHRLLTFFRTAAYVKYSFQVHHKCITKIGVSLGIKQWFITSVTKWGTKIKTADFLVLWIFPPRLYEPTSKNVWKI